MVLMEKERLQGKDQRRRWRAEGTVWAHWSAFWSYVLGLFSFIVAGYGHRPQWAFRWMIVLIAAATLLYSRVWDAGLFAPNDAIILESEDWKKAQAYALRDPTFNPAQDWATNAPAGKDFESYSSLAYGFDVVVPRINLGQEDAWAPSTRAGWRSSGWWGWWLRRVFEIMGWIVSALGAAAITGVIRRKD